MRQYSQNTILTIRVIAVISLSLLILSFVSPQVTYYGRGLRTAVPALVISGFAILQLSAISFFNAFKRLKLIILLFILFLIQAFLRFILENESNISTQLFHTYFWGPVYVLVILIMVSALAECGENTLKYFRYSIVISWCLSLALGLPTIISNPGIARYIMGEYSNESIAILSKFGVGEYTVYTSFAICFGSIIIISRYFKSKMRWLIYFLIFLAGFAVLFSTFTMAFALLIMNLILTLFVIKQTKFKISRLIYGILVLLVVLYIILQNIESTKFSQIEFVISKIDRLIEGVFSSGLSQGDETSRGSWFISELNYFAGEPFIGYIPGVIGIRGGGHSSLSNTLVLFGIFGSMLWFGTLWKIFRECINDQENLRNKRVIQIGWIILVIGGILNPIWHSPEALGTLIALTLPTPKQMNEHDLLFVNQ